ncbi:LacI family DNA-binding transcriptional regulator [Rhodanobacter sp. L36]|uniref:LacI family DNA-binding transcriptional regulator n=1 Tax=Rhodanobacter sp. L36 TaxID=1747221 RepID=UPI00131AE42C|nr:LacI family DNA-binding transcriptional regulator [Rhodanobacter sp. L36]
MAAVTIKDVAREARVSVASVSRALNGGNGVTAETGQRIREVAKRLRYVPHAAARTLITRRTNTIGALLPDLHGEFFSELIRGIDLAARARGFHLLVSSSHDSVEEAAAALRAMQGRVDGMLILSPRVDAAFLQSNLPASLPAVLLNSAVESDEYGVLNIDNYTGAYAMVRHLVDTGHNDIAFITGPEKNFDAEQREMGYRAAMAAHAPNAAINIVAGDFTEDSGYRAGRTLLAHAARPQAVFAANDMMAVGCLFALKEAGLNIPQDIALAGFDDIPIARYVTPPLTTVRVRIVDLGRSALEQLAALLENPDSPPASAQTLGCEIITRETCGMRLAAPLPNQKQNSNISTFLSGRDS